MKKIFIPVYEPELSGNELKYLTKCIKTNWISSLGGYVTRFEEDFGKFVGTKHAISTSSGTTALHLALAALGIGKDDEVIVPDLTFVATANAVSYTGAKPVFVDASHDTWNIDPRYIEKKITKRTKAIIAVHLYGHSADMDPILAIAKSHGLFVIEDAAEAHGAEYKGSKVGSLSDIGCFSFYGNKIITTGEGGIVVTNNADIEKRVKMLRDHAMSQDQVYWHEAIGYNYRMTNIQAAIGVAQLERIANIIEIKRENAMIYNSFLRDIPCIILPPELPWAKSVYWMYSILIEKTAGISRNKLMIVLKENGIDSRPFFVPMHKLPMYAHRSSYPVATRLSNTGINLPSSTKITRADIQYIASVIKANLAGPSRGRKPCGP